MIRRLTILLLIVNSLFAEDDKNNLIDGLSMKFGRITSDFSQSESIIQQTYYHYNFFELNKLLKHNTMLGIGFKSRGCRTGSWMCFGVCDLYYTIELKYMTLNLKRLFN